MRTVTLKNKPNINGTIVVPPSKSFAQRALAIASLANKPCTIHKLGTNNDSQAALDILQALGAEISREGNSVIIQNGIDRTQKGEITINCGESGLSTRLFSCFSLLFNQTFTITGEGSVKSRTMHMIVEGLKQFGKTLESNQGRLPLTATGKVTNHTVEIDGSLSSQFLTGLLVVAPFLKENTTINVANLKSVPYVQMTLDMLDVFGLHYAHKEYNQFLILGRQEIAANIEYTVEGDWSSASYFIVAGAIGGEICLKGLLASSSQGDKALVYLVKQAGAVVEWRGEDLWISRSKLKAFNFDATDCPDLFPALVVLAIYAEGTSKITGVSRLTHKESNRALVLQEEVAKLGIEIVLEGEEMIIDGNKGDFSAREVLFDAHNDHRIAMAMSLFTIGSGMDVKIKGADAIDKSYPNFFTDFSAI